MTFNFTQRHVTRESAASLSRPVGVVLAVCCLAALAAAAEKTEQHAPDRLAAFIVPKPVAGIVVMPPAEIASKHGRKLDANQLALLQRRDGKLLTAGTYHLFRVPNNGRTQVQWTGKVTGNKQLVISAGTTRLDGRHIMTDGKTHTRSIIFDRPPAEPYLYVMVNCSRGSVQSDALTWQLDADPEAVKLVWSDAQQRAADRLGVTPARKLKLAPDVELPLVLIPPGEFVMGSNLSPADTAKQYGGHAAWFEDEHPPTAQRIEEAFYLGACEVTVAQFETVLYGELRQSGRAGLPAVRVSWSQAQSFCRALSKRLHTEVRLPTEAEWEYASRYGRGRSPYCFGFSAKELGEYAWFNGSVPTLGAAGAQTVAQKKPNPWGLYDMHGNVWEWCRDTYDRNRYRKIRIDDSPEDARRVARGGSFATAAWACRSATRLPLAPSLRLESVGFRVVMKLQSNKQGRE